MAFDKLHAALLRITHIIIWLRVFFWTFSRWFSKPSSLFLNFTDNNTRRKQMVEKCCTDSKNLPKLPLHVGLQILEDRISDSDVARILLWCIAMRIPYVTIFDAQGYLKKNSARLEKNLQRKMGGLGSLSDCFMYQLEAPVRNGDESWEVLHTHKAASDGCEKTRIALLDAQDGRLNIIDSAKKICQSVSDRRCKPANVDIPHLDEYMKESMVFPDPELIIQFGTVESLMGYLPWNIRVTEILSIPTHHHADYQSFHSVLQAYSKTQQRYGK